MRTITLAALAAALTIPLFPSPVAHAQPSPCEVLAGTDQDGSCVVYASTPAYQINISFPVDYSDPAPLVDYLKQTRDGFVNVSQMPGSRNLPYELDVTAQEFTSAAPLQKGTQSVVLELFQDVGGAHPVTWYKTFTYNLDTRTPVTFDTLFKPGTDPLTVIFPVVQQQLERETGQPGIVMPGDGTDPSRYQNFALTNDDLIFFFGQGELLPSAAGATVVRVPRNVVAPILA